MSIPLLYLDTSAWLKLYVEEDGSEAVHTAMGIFHLSAARFASARVALGLAWFLP